MVFWGKEGGEIIDFAYGVLSRSSQGQYEFLNRNHYFLLHIFITEVKAFSKHYNKVFFLHIKST